MINNNKIIVDIVEDVSSVNIKSSDLFNLWEERNNKLRFIVVISFKIKSKNRLYIESKLLAGNVMKSLNK